MQTTSMQATPPYTSSVSLVASTTASTAAAAAVSCMAAHQTTPNHKQEATQKMRPRTCEESNNISN